MISNVSISNVFQILLDFIHLIDSDAPDGFLNEWPDISQQMPNVLQLYNKKIQTKWDRDVKSILMLLKLLPFTPHRTKSQAKKAPTAYVADCFMDFIKVRYDL